MTFELITMERLDVLRNKASQLKMQFDDLHSHGPGCCVRKDLKAAYDFATMTAEEAVIKRIEQMEITKEKLAKWFPLLNWSFLKEGHLEEQIKFANEEGHDRRRESLLEAFACITRDGEREARIFYDHAPHSFYFECPMYNGGIIFHPAGSGSGAEAPIFSVTLNDTRDVWQVHT